MTGGNRLYCYIASNVDSNERIKQKKKATCTVSGRSQRISSLKPNCTVERFRIMTKAYLFSKETIGQITISNHRTDP
jgi:hypothetical protein